MTITLDASDLPATRTSLGANDASNLTTGTLADGRFPATLPAASAQNLTAIPAANISGVIPPANLGTGTANSSTFLNGSGAYSAAGGGGLEFIGTAVSSGSSTELVVTGLDNSFDCYRVVGSNFSGSVANQVIFTVGESGGLIITGYQGFYNEFFGGVATGNPLAMGDRGVEAGNTEQIPANTNGHYDFVYDIFRTTVKKGPRIMGYFFTRKSNNTPYGGFMMAGLSTVNDDITQVRAAASTGNFTTGRITVHGVKNS